MNLAIFLPSWIGDVVMATPALRALRAHFHGARLLAIHKPYVAGLLDGAPWFDEHLHLDKTGPWSRRWPAVAARLERERIDLAVLFPNTLRTALAARLGGCKRRVGYARYGRTFLLTDPLTPLCDGGGRRVPSPVIDAYNRLAEHVGCPRPSYRMELFTTPRDEAAADAVWRGFRLSDFPEVICLNPGAAFGAAKYWPVEHFATLARELAIQRSAGVLVLCGPGEQEMARMIAHLAKHPAVCSLADTALSLGLTKACVRRCDLLVTTDSGPRHFAAAFGRPVVTLFGPTHVAWTETYQPHAIHLQKRVPCGPCQRRVCPEGHHRCMRELLPADVFAAVVSLRERPAYRAG